MPSKKPGPYPWVVSRSLYIIVKRFLDTGSALLVQTWSKTANNWVTYVHADRDNYVLWLVPEDYPTNSSPNYILHPSDYPDWDLENEHIVCYVYEEDPYDVTTGTGTAANPDDQCIWIETIGSPNANLTSIQANKLAVLHLKTLLNAFRIGTVVDDAANSSSTFKTDLEQLGNDFYINRVLAWPEGTTNETQESLVTAFDNTSQFITAFPAFAAEPVAGEQFIIGGRIN